MTIVVAVSWLAAMPMLLFDIVVMAIQASFVLLRINPVSKPVIAQFDSSGLRPFAVIPAPSPVPLIVCPAQSSFAPFMVSPSPWQVRSAVSVVGLASASPQVMAAAECKRTNDNRSAISGLKAAIQLFSQISLFIGLWGTVPLQNTEKKYISQSPFYIDPDSLVYQDVWRDLHESAKVNVSATGFQSGWQGHRLWVHSWPFRMGTPGHEVY